MTPQQRKFLENVDNANHICFEIKWLLRKLDYIYPLDFFCRLCNNIGDSEIL